MNIKERYKKEIAPKLQEELGIKNVMAIPTVKKITVSIGIPASNKDAKFTETAEQTLERITGQKPEKTKAKKSVAGFKIREGMTVGMMVTLRGDRMWDFLSRLTQTTFPRIRDFRGISTKHVDARGNISIGFQENLAFPEINPDEVEHIHGLQVTVTSNAGTRERGLALFKALSFPFTQ